MENILSYLASMRPIVLERSLSHDLNKALCQLPWNTAGTRIEWCKQGSHQLIKFGSGVELGELDTASLSAFKVLKQDEIVLFFSAYESALFISREALLNNWKLLDNFIAANFFLMPYKDVLSMQINYLVECNPLSFIAGHI